MRNKSGHEKKSRVCAAKVGLIVCALAFSVFASPVHADELVRTVQKKLTSLGYYKGKADGSEGSMTSAAIRRFQIAKKLKVTGSLNRQTLDSLGLDGPFCVGGGRFHGLGLFSLPSHERSLTTFRH